MTSTLTIWDTRIVRRGARQLLVLRHFRRLHLMSRFALRRLLGFGMGGGGVRPAGRSFVRLTRFSRVRAVMYHLWVGLGEQPGENQRGTGDRGSNQGFISP
jgi:hypothetical protein